MCRPFSLGLMTSPVALVFARGKPASWDAGSRAAQAPRRVRRARNQGKRYRRWAAQASEERSGAGPAGGRGERRA